MRNVLILGGTGWLGRELAIASLAAGDRVTCLARGESGGVPDGVELVRADRAMPDAYDGAMRDWDEVVELAWDNTLVTGALDALAPHAKRWTLISTISVYASNSEPGADETAEVVLPVDLTDYGQAKVAAERASADTLGDRLLVVRPGLIAGPGDPSDRFGYWVARMALAGSAPVLSMTLPARTAQAVDVRDLADFVVSASASGVANAVGTSIPLAGALDYAAATADFTGPIIEADDDWLLEHEVGYWAGPRSLPLWLPPEDAAMTARSNDAYRAAGGAIRPLEETLRDVLADERARGLDRERRAGLTRADELRLLADLRAEAPRL